jgi:Mg2+ and Co2+ transporter CorA
MSVMDNDFSMLGNANEQKGLLFAFHFSGDGLGHYETFPDHENASITDGFWWVHAHLTDTRCREWIASQDWLTEEARDILLSHEVHDRIETEEGQLAGLFVDAKLDFDGDDDEMAELRFVLADRILLTGRRRSLRSVENTRIAIERGKLIESPLELLEEIVDRESDYMAKAASDLGHEVDSIEDKIMAGYVNDARALTPRVRRRAITLHRQMSRLLVLFRRVERAPATRLPADLRDAAGRIAQRLESIYQEIHSSQDRARLLQDEVSAYLANETNKQLYVLSMLTALFLPATLVTGFFGMNTKGLPFAEDEFGFWYAFGIAAIAAALTYFALLLILRRRTSE